MQPELLSNADFLLLTALGGLLLAMVITVWALLKVNKQNRIRLALQAELNEAQRDNEQLGGDLRQRIASVLRSEAKLFELLPLEEGRFPDEASLEGRNRIKCVELILHGLPRDNRSQAIRMAEFTHQLCEMLFAAYGKDTTTTLLKIEAQPIILDVECALAVGMMLNELISNAFKYAPEPGEKCKVHVLVAERNAKLSVSVLDNGIGMKSPYEPKFKFGLQLVRLLASQYKGEVLISSRPGTRVEVVMSEHQKAVREVFITPTQRIH